VTELPIDPLDTEASKRRTLLRLGDSLGWWRYESENQPGHVDRHGHTYAGITYTLLLTGPGWGNRPAAERERVLLADEVLGYVLRAADERGDAARVAFRDGLLHPTGGE
jgi:hypothetical protein